MTELAESWYPRVCKWGFNPVHCRAASLGLAILVGIAYALSRPGGWPTSAASHLALAHLGLICDSTIYHPIWGWCLRKVDAVWLSVLSAGLSVGLLTFCVARAKNIVAGVAVGSLLSLSPWFVAVGTTVAFAPFDLMLLLAVVALMPLVGESGGWYRWPLAIAVFGLLVLDLLRATIGNPFEPLLDGVTLSLLVALFLGWGLVSTLEGSKPLLALVWMGVIGVVVMVACVSGSLLDVRGGKRLADGLSGIVLGKCGDRVKWLITDGALEDALAYRLAQSGSKIHLVCLAHDRDARSITNLVETVKRDYPQATSLRMAAKLGVVPFLEELSFVETNDQAIVSVWGRTVWDGSALAKVREMIDEKGRARRDPLRKYVEARIAGMTRRGDGAKGAAAAQLLRMRLGDSVPTGDKAERINAMIDRIAREVKAGDVRKAHAWATQLVREDRTNPLGNALLGTSAAIDGDDEAAVLHFGRAVRRGNAPVLVWNDYAESLRRVGRYDDAERAIAGVLPKAPREWRLYETLADIRYTAKCPAAQVEEALAQAEALAKRAPANQRQTLAFLRAALLWRSGKREQARMQMKRLKAVADSPYLKMRIRGILEAAP